MAPTLSHKPPPPRKIQLRHNVSTVIYLGISISLAVCVSSHFNISNANVERTEWGRIERNHLNHFEMDVPKYIYVNKRISVRPSEKLTTYLFINKNKLMNLVSTRSN